MSGKNTSTSLQVAIGAGAPIALNAEGGAADWIMLVPVANGVVATVDSRGPYRVSNAQALADASLHAAGGRIPIDENHATDLAAPQGRPAPARGWATELQARGDGIYGRVEWSAPGSALLSEHAYRFISPVITHDAAGNITGLLRASLTNRPNLRGMTALHSEEPDMDLLAQLRKLLGLADDADEAAVIAKINAMQDKPAADDAALQSALAPIATAAGLTGAVDATTVLTAVTALAAGKSLGNDATVIALQSELKTLGERLNATVLSTATEKATGYVDGEIAKGRVGVKPLRDHYIAMHAVDPARVEKEIGAMPILGASGALTTPPDNKDGKVSLNSEQATAAKILGISVEDYAKTLAAEQALA